LGSTRGDFAGQWPIAAGRTASAGDYLFDGQDQRRGFCRAQGAGVGRGNSAVTAQHFGVRGEARAVVVGESFTSIHAAAGHWVDHCHLRTARTRADLARKSGVGERGRYDMGVGDWNIQPRALGDDGHFGRLRVEFRGHLFLGRGRGAGTGDLGFAGTAARADQPGRRGLCADGAHFLFLRCDGQTRTLGQPDRNGRAAPGGWMDSGAHTAPADRAHAEERGMNALQKGLLLGALQVAIVASLGAKLTWDRHRLPRGWARVGVYDPELPIRGRYLALQLEVVCDNAAAAPAAPASPRDMRHPQTFNGGYVRGVLRVENGRLASDCSSSTEGANMFRRFRPGQVPTTNLSEPVLFFLPEHATDPWKQAKGGELWAEVTLPASGPPRPIRLAIKQGNAFTPLETK